MKKTRLDKTKHISPENRRLDTLAKLITGNSVCAAVTIADNKLLISTNLLSVKDANTLNTSFQSELPLISNSLSLSPANNQLFNILNTIYKCSTKESPSSEDIGFLCKFVCRYMMDRYIDHNIGYGELIQSLPSISNKDNSEIIEKFVKDFIKGFYNHDNFMYLYNHLHDINKQCGWGNSQIKIANFLSFIKKSYNDSNKIIELLRTDKFPTIKNLIQEKAFVLVGADKEPNIQKDPHAEMNLINYLIENNSHGQYYIGISKLTCFDCTNDIIAVNNNGIITVTTRGAHNVNYSSRRVEPELKLDDIEYYRERFKDLPKSEQGKTIEHADFSDSDAAEDYLLLGLVLDESEL